MSYSLTIGGACTLGARKGSAAGLRMRRASGFAIGKKPGMGGEDCSRMACIPGAFRTHFGRLNGVLDLSVAFVAGNFLKEN
jgi:hypothetical protein